MFAIILVISTVTAFAQQSSTVLCVPGQCLQGYSNTTIGATISAPGIPTDVLLLPGQYTSDSSPQLLHSVLTSSAASLSPSPGFNASLKTLPLNLALGPGLAIFSDTLYSGQSGFSALPTNLIVNSSSPLAAKSLSLSSNIWITTTNGSPDERVILWDSVPDINELPLGLHPISLSLVDIQLNACSPPCAASGICSASGTCKCAPGFTGSSCETCETGFFGPKCQPCPANCTTCDDGITGSGRCLQPIVANAPSTCNCLNGVCGTNGSCTCNTGFTKSDNGTACAKCSPGFFSTSTEDCKVCQLGCTACQDGTGICTTCKSGFTQNQNDRTKCDPPQSVTSSGTICPDGSFSNGSGCTRCASSCDKCTGGTSNDCIVCASGLYSLNGACVSADSNGICSGTNMIADNNKVECDACDAKCTSCKIPNFTSISTANLVQCTGCLPGFFLSNGSCVESCPSGTFVSPQDHLTCIPCDSSCGTCAGASSCMACSSPDQVLRGGTCIAADCKQNSTVVPGLGVCLSELVIVPQPSGTSAAAPLPTITGINTPTPPLTKRSLEWWQILLMALGCAFILLVFIWCCRRRARKQRTKKTAMFASQPGYGRMAKSSWRWRLIRFGEKLFGHKRSRKADLVIRHHTLQEETEAVKLRKIRMAEEARVDSEQDLVQLIGDYNYPDPKESSLGQQHYYQGHEHDDDRLLPVDHDGCAESDTTATTATEEEGFDIEILDEYLE
ncbi:Protein MAM3 [Termitomyces sp. T112]|nr:Protein MAM3 [Termitomyces sp. T112]